MQGDEKWCTTCWCMAYTHTRVHCMCDAEMQQQDTTGQQRCGCHCWAAARTVHELASDTHPPLYTPNAHHHYCTLFCTYLSQLHCCSIQSTRVAFTEWCRTSDLIHSHCSHRSTFVCSKLHCSFLTHSILSAALYAALCVLIRRCCILHLDH